RTGPRGPRCGGEAAALCRPRRGRFPGDRPLQASCRGAGAPRCRGPSGVTPMATEIKVPNLGESITEATVAKWLKRPGEAVAADEPIAELETDKVTLEVPAPASGTLAEILAEEGANVPVGAILGRIADGLAVKAVPHPSLLPAGGQREGPAQREREGQRA